MSTKVADSKGRIALGSEFAGKTFIVQKSDHGFVLESAVTIPEREAWLYRNQKAMETVQRGIGQLAAGEFSPSPPDLAADAKLMENIED